MTGFALGLVALVVVGLLVVVWRQGQTIDRQATEQRRLTQRILNALVAEDARELAALNRVDVSEEAREFLERERVAEDSHPLPHGLR